MNAPTVNRYVHGVLALGPNENIIDIQSLHDRHRRHSQRFSEGEELLIYPTEFGLVEITGGTVSGGDSLA
jgi:hypothetical protein